MFTSIFQQLDANSCIITANRRLAGFVRQTYDAWQISLGKSAWPTLDILPLNAWLLRCYHQLDQTKLVLTPHQEILIWQQVIENYNQKHDLNLIHSMAAAELAKQAFELINHDGLDLADLENLHLNQDVQTFIHWAKAFILECEQKQSLSQSWLPTLILQAIEAQPMRYPQTFWFYGFDHYALKIDQIKKKLKLVEADDLIFLNQTSLRVACHDTLAEIHAMVAYAKQTLEKNPQAKIACVVPDLNQQRELIVNAFEQAFRDEKNIWQMQRGKLFNISAAPALADYGIIDLAFTVLKLLSGHLTYNEFSQLLLSRYLQGGFSEHFKRANLDAKLRETCGIDYHIQQTIALASEKDSEHYCPIWLSMLEKLRNYTRRLKTTYLASDWVKHFSELLDILAWPGDVNVDSANYQIVQRFEKLLLEFKSLNFILGQISAEVAIFQLKRLAQQTAFQIQTVTEPRIQILGLLEASGLSFDYCWIMGLNAENFPAKPKPNPYLPIFLQREFNMPHASSTRELNYASALLHRYQSSNQHLICSYALQSEESQLAPSKLIEKFPLVQPADLKIHPIATAALFKLDKTYLENYSENEIEVQAEEPIHGGTAILKSQAACPFQAFAYYRLNANSLDEPDFGLNALDRGSLMHYALAFVWQQLQDSKTLHSLAESKLKLLIEESVNYAFKLLKFKDKQFLLKNFLEIEQKRLTNLLLAWLHFEKQREYFKVIAIEAEKKIDLFGLKLHLRIDRIDQLENNNYLLIDYKTGFSRIKDWFGNRIDEPQLPIYALSDAKITAMTFAQIKANHLEFRGFSQDEISIAGIKAITDFEYDEKANSWQAQKALWQDDLAILAKQFLSGHASIDPKYASDTCEYCDLQDFCRINQGISHAGE